jgi:hypothetical protein
LCRCRHQGRWTGRAIGEAIGISPQFGATHLTVTPLAATSSADLQALPHRRMINDARGPFLMKSMFSDTDIGDK